MPKIFSLKGFDAAHIKRTEEYARAIDGIYNEAVRDYAAIADRLKIDPKKPFSFKDYPSAKKKADELMVSLASKMKSVITEGTKEQWLYACKKNDEFIASIMNTTKVPKKTLEAWQDRNLSALKAFQERKINGLGLSDRIWNYSGQMKTQMELGIDIALGDGKSAQSLSKELKQYLVDPDKLFRRVRDKHGSLVLSKSAKAFNPGQGKYRSSHKNALRLTRTEINMAYRESDRLRWSNLDFVVGFEVKLSNNHTINGVPFVDICDHLKGKYPKTFVFRQWHPQCRCHATPILMEPDEFDTDELNELKAAINGTEYKPYASKNAVTDVPDGFKSWINDNAERSKGWASQPYFIKDNFVGGTIEGGLKIAKKIDNLDAIDNVIKMPTELLSVEQKYNYGKIDVQKHIDLEIAKTERDLVGYDNQIKVYEEQVKSLSGEKAFDTYTKNFKPGVEIPKTITRDSGEFELFEAKKDMFSPNMVAEYRKYKDGSSAAAPIKRKIAEYEEKIIESKQRLSKLKDGSLNAEIEKQVLRELKKERADSVYFKYVTDEDLIPDLAKELKKDLKATNTFSAKGTSTEYLETKYGKIRISDHESRFEQDMALGSKASQNRPVEFDIEDHNIVFNKDKNGFIVRVNDKEYYVHEYNINNRDDLLEFAKTKLKRQINEAASKESLTTSVLEKIYDFDEETAIRYMAAKTEEERMIIDVIRISKMDNFEGKVARTIVENGFTSISPKQSDILQRYVVKPIDVTKKFMDRAEQYMANARYRQAGSSLRRR